MFVVGRERSSPVTRSRPMTSTIRAAGRVLKSAPTGTSRRSTFRVAVAYGREGLDRSTPYVVSRTEDTAVKIDIEDRFRHRVSEEQVAQVLQRIATLPNKREQPIAGDVSGMFDFWFDGGAGRIITGWNEYELADGTQVTVGTFPALSVGIKFPDGSRVSVQEESWGDKDGVAR